MTQEYYAHHTKFRIPIFMNSCDRHAPSRNVQTRTCKYRQQETLMVADTVKPSYNGTTVQNFPLQGGSVSNTYLKVRSSTD